MEIYLCEDDPQQLQQLQTLITNQLLFKDYQPTFVLGTPDPQALLNFLQQRDLQEQDLLFFLDIDLKATLDGLQLAQKLKAQYANGKIVFITTHNELMSLVFKYQIEALDYLEKGAEHLPAKISQCLDVAFQRFAKSDAVEHLVLQSQGKQLNLPLKEILFFESSVKAHRVTVHLYQRQVDFYGKIKDLPQLNPQFLRVHQSYVVNRQNIDYYEQKRHVLVMKNQEECAVSVRYRKELLRYLQE